MTGNKIEPLVPAFERQQTRADDWSALSAYLAHKLSTLPKPIAVFAYCDYDAAKIEAAALEAGLRVPEEIAILGVDNDPLVCENIEVPISSICHERQRIGYEGSALLHALMSGKRPKRRNLTIRPRAIEERASTRGVYSDDPIVQRVISFFSIHLADRVGLCDAAAATGLKPRALERHFAEHAKRSVTSYLRELRLIRARQLVTGTSDRLGDIAAACGFANAQHFSNAFREAFGQTPTQIRSNSK